MEQNDRMLIELMLKLRSSLKIIRTYIIKKRHIFIRTRRSSIA